MNTARVNANVTGTLLIACASLDDNSTAEWKITSSSNGVLQIDVASTSSAAMDGDWTIKGDGRLDVDSKGFSTTGSLVWTGGTIDCSESHTVVDFGVDS